MKALIVLSVLAAALLLLTLVLAVRVVKQYERGVLFRLGRLVGSQNVRPAIDQIAQTTLHKLVGQHTLDETLSEIDRINGDIQQILDATTGEWVRPG